MNTNELRTLMANIEADHRLVREQLWCLKELAESLSAEGPGHWEAALEALGRVEHAFRNDVLPHFASEESELFPVLRDAMPHARSVIDELEREHATLREQFESFGGQLALLRYTELSDQGALICSLTRTCWEIWDSLRQHASREDRVISEYVMKQLETPLLARERGH